MHYPIKVIDLELTRPITNLESLDEYVGILGLIRLHGTPIGYVKAPVTAGCCSAEILSKIILTEHGPTISRYLLQNESSVSVPVDDLRLEDFFNTSSPKHNNEILPLVTVAVCTRDRTSDLAMCMEAINALDYPHLDLLVVDNAPASKATEQLVRTNFPNVRYICEPRPGLDWARNRAINEARGEIIAFTDDDVVVDPGWVKALASIFAQHPDVMAVTGLIVPYELETEAQLFFENYGGFGRGFKRKWVQVKPKSGYNKLYQGTGQFGTGANMAYRRSIFEKIGFFDPALDVGTVTNGGGDIEMFFRVLKEGYTLIYEPRALVRHRHRREYTQLRTQFTNNGIAFAAYLVRCALAYPDEFLPMLVLSLWFLWGWNIRPWLNAVVNPAFLPRELIEAQLFGFFVGLGRYQRARSIAAQLAEIERPLTQSAALEPKSLPKHLHTGDMQMVD